jgi:hypothetical protein
MAFGSPEMLLATVVDLDVDVRRVSEPIVNARRYRVETTTTTTYGSGRRDSRTDFHNEWRSNIFRATRHVAVDVAVIETSDGARMRIDVDDLDVRRGQAVLLVGHDVLGLRALDVLRISDRCWLTEIWVPGPGRWPAVLCTLTGVGLLIAEADLGVVAFGTCAVFAGSHVLLAVLRLARIQLLRRARRQATHVSRDL